MPSDRTILKDQQLGALGTAPEILLPRAAVNAMHEETFLFTTFAAAPYVEQGIPILKAARVTSIRLLPATTLAADGVNNISCVVSKRDGVGGSAVVIGTSTTDVAGLALTQYIPKVVALSTVAGATALAAGNVLTFRVADNGTTTEPLLTVAITVEYV